MISATCASASNHCQFVIRANHSMSWKQTLWFLYATYTVTGAVVAMCIYYGLWMVLPFSGLEMLVLTICLYTVSRRTSTYEVITVNQEQVIIETGRRRVQERKVFPRYWAKVALTSPPHRWYASRLIIGSHGKRVEIGRYLVEQERIDLARALAQLLQGPQSVNGYE
ncbi:MAG: hypothetical protein BWK79_09120 [Beggiatoa sp. IS2]|nr:MAG: hypothetical protein BWK79_09120 [Beggiatoa sp. IS2]